MYSMTSTTIVVEIREIGTEPQYYSAQRIWDSNTGTRCISRVGEIVPAGDGPQVLRMTEFGRTAPGTFAPNLKCTRYQPSTHEGGDDA